MPQLMSHRDGFGWQTPHLADILITPPPDDGQTQQLRGLATLIVRRLAELGTPVRLLNMERYTSHTRYHLAPDKLGGLDHQREVTLSDLEGVLPKLLPQLNGTKAAELVSLHPDDSTISLFLRTGQHNPLNLQELLEKKAFLEAINYSTLALGVDLAQQALVRDLDNLRHLLVIGQTNARLHLMLGIASSLMLFNSPTYLRLAMVGNARTPLQLLMTSPHVLGNMVQQASGLRRLFDGLVKHITQRQSIFQKDGISSIDEYNKRALSDKNLKPLPRIVVLLDSVVFQNWNEQLNNWIVPFHQLLNKGANVGIHIVMAVSAWEAEYIPERLQAEFPHRVVLRSALNSIEELAPHTQQIPMNFIDAVWWSNGSVVPLELAAIAELEITRLSTYWQNMKMRRNTELQTKGQPMATGNTGLLTLRGDMLPTSMLTPTEEETTPVIDTTQPIPIENAPIITDRMVGAAQALAAYLGWLSMGPLRDVLNLNPAEATEMVQILRAIGVLEDGDGPVWRFVRLADVPGSEV